MKEESKDDHILNCPFCGSKAELILRGNLYSKKRSAEIECTNCHTKQITGAIRNSLDWCKGTAIEKWNKRTSLTSVSEGEDWISVEDGLPELGDEVISIDKDLVKKLSKYTTYHENSIGYMEGKRDKWFQYIEHGYAFHHHHVTHWRYQPAPPKELTK